MLGFEVIGTAHDERGARLQIAEEIHLLGPLGRDVQRRGHHVEASSVDALDQVGEARVEESRLQAQLFTHELHELRIKTRRLFLFEEGVWRVCQVRANR
ncbi:hypothetical protein D3C73_648710 [compost metagenome]